MDRDLKRSIILDNYQSPNNKHTSDDSYFKINTRNVSCIDNLDIYLKIEDNIIKDISFEGEACVISISSTNILTNLLIGKTKEEGIYLINNYLKMINEEEYDKETQSKFLNVIASEARRMAKLVTDLLTLSKNDNNRNVVKKEQFDLGELVKKCQDKLAIEIKRKNHNVNCFVTADVPLVYADKDDIERVVLNIMTNSIKYTKEGGEIKIYVGFVYNDAYIKIFDNGIGIPEEDLSRIFERFYRVDKARSREMGGTGLGLSIAKDLLDRNGGSIDIKSEVGKGTEVVIKVPTKEK